MFRAGKANGRGRVGQISRSDPRWNGRGRRRAIYGVTFEAASFTACRNDSTESPNTRTVER